MQVMARMAEDNFFNGGVFLNSGCKYGLPIMPNILKNTGTTDKISQQSGNLQECNAVSEIPKSSKLKLFKYFSKQLFLFRYRSDRLVTITSLSKIGF